ncbi:TetR/AcrR family transcriptional regulator [Streptomyces sp. NPDC085932]|uniref:TetR/AcrR family transcriptional regulator n=1 Tax=Streptomyces sp. NPDC085932 TaxID=3365741 RepID=UPI0037D0280F
MSDPTSSTGSSPRRRRRTGTYRAADGRRSCIIDCATRLFSEHGYHSTSLSRIATEAGTSQAALLHHFKTKESLLLAVLRTSDLRQAGRFGSAELGLRRLALDIVDAVAADTDSPGLARLFVVIASEATAADHPAHEYFRNRYRLILSHNAAAIRASVDDGSVHPETDVDALARDITATADGLKFQWLLSSDFDLPGQLRQRLDLIVRAVSRDGRGLS